MEIGIRSMKKEDITEVCLLMMELTGNEISEEDMINRMEMVNESKIDELYVYQGESSIQGVMGFRIRENIEEKSCYGEISVIVTNSNDRRSGIGKAMMDFAENLARQKGCIGTWLVSGFGREEEAHNFYKKLGYVINGYRFVKPFND